MPDLEPPPESPTQVSPPLQPFACELRSNGRAATWIRVCGELDLATAPQFEQALQQALSSALLVVIDLRDLTFIDGSGLRSIIEAGARARRSGRRLVFVRGPAQIDRVFEFVGLSDRLEIIDLKPGRASASVLSGPDALNAA